ncbi:MAG: septum formation protein Maf [Bacteroidales bacterium]|nr:septum formation protein Maf [Bacteroidales bacterium]MBN2819047.1 septum formation protein Maf [Bacteroidales bacterium]
MLLHQLLNDYKLILASQSPRRRMLLEGLDLSFEVIVRENIDEKVPEGLLKTQIPVYLAQHKSDAYVDLLNTKTIVLTADTIVWINNRELGKPQNRNHAIEILKELSGNIHEVVTGVCIRSSKQQHSFYSLSSVHFRKLTEQEIEYYIDKYQPFDKAGSYGIQEWIGYTAIEKIDGSFYNVMGLPVQALNNELNRFIRNEKNKENSKYEKV